MKRLCDVGVADFGGVSPAAVATTSAKRTVVAPCVSLPPGLTVHLPPYCFTAAITSVRRAIAAACRSGAYQPIIEVLPPVSCQPNSGLAYSGAAGACSARTWRQLSFSSVATSCDRPVMIPCPISDDPIATVTVLLGLTRTKAPTETGPGETAARAASGVRVTAKGMTSAPAAPRRNPRRSRVAPISAPESSRSSMVGSPNLNGPGAGIRGPERPR